MNNYQTKYAAPAASNDPSAPFAHAQPFVPNVPRVPIVIQQREHGSCNWKLVRFYLYSLLDAITKSFIFWKLHGAIEEENMLLPFPFGSYPFANTTKSYSFTNATLKDIAIENGVAAAAFIFFVIVFAIRLTLFLWITVINRYNIYGTWNTPATAPILPGNPTYEPGRVICDLCHNSWLTFLVLFSHSLSMDTVVRYHNNVFDTKDIRLGIIHCFECLSESIIICHEMTELQVYVLTNNWSGLFEDWHFWILLLCIVRFLIFTIKILKSSFQLSGLSSRDALLLAILGLLDFACIIFNAVNLRDIVHLDNELGKWAKFVFYLYMIRSVIIFPSWLWGAVAYDRYRGRDGTPSSFVHDMCYNSYLVIIMVLLGQSNVMQGFSWSNVYRVPKKKVGFLVIIFYVFKSICCLFILGAAAISKNSKNFELLIVSLILTTVHAIISAAPFFKHKCVAGNGGGSGGAFAAATAYSPLCFYGNRRHIGVKIMSILSFLSMISILFLCSIEPLASSPMKGNRIPSTIVPVDACSLAGNVEELCNFHGTCTNNKNNDGYICNCNTNWGGLKCTKQVCPHGKSSMIACSNHGTCYSNSRNGTTGHSAFSCKCDPGYTGQACDIPLPCYQYDCGEHGNCSVTSSNQPFCSCDKGWSGDTCQTSTCPSGTSGGDIQNQEKCSAHGQCVSGSCICADGWSGNACETPPDTCYEMECGKHGHCAIDGITKGWPIVIMVIVFLAVTSLLFEGLKLDEGHPHKLKSKAAAGILFFIWIITLVVFITKHTFTSAGCICRAGYYGNSCQCYDNGNYDSASCTQCASGFYGDRCQNKCNCNGNGKCEDGIDGSGFCDCDDGWMGVTCDKRSSTQACYPTDALVNVLLDRCNINANNSCIVSKSMNQLSIGDNVEIDHGVFDRVIAFGHRDPTQYAEYWKFQAVRGATGLVDSAPELDIADGHYLYANNELTLPHEIKIGDVLSSGVVTKIGKVKKEGLFHPHTWSSTIVVNSVKTSTNTNFTTLIIQDYVVTPFMYILYLIGLPIDLVPESLMWFFLKI